MVKVYLLESGCYEQRGVVGVYSTPEKAMAAWHPSPGAGRNNGLMGAEYRQPPGTRWDYQWEKEDDGNWRFMADWDDAAEIFEIEVDA